MEKAWIGVGALGVAMSAGILLQAGQIRGLEQRIDELESQAGAAIPAAPEEVPSRVENSGSSPMGKGTVLEAEDTEEVATPSVDQNGTGVAVPPEVLQEAVRAERARERQERDRYREERVQEFQEELIAELSEKLSWSGEQESQVRNILADTFARRMELRGQMREGELDHADMREMMQEIRDDAAQKLEESVGVEGLEAIAERIPGRRPH